MPDLDTIYRRQEGEPFLFSAENAHAERGSGGAESSAAGPRRKGRPAVMMKPSETLTLMDTNQTGIVRHIWLTTGPLTKDTVETVTFEITRPGESKPSVSMPLLYFFGDFEPYTVGLATRKPQAANMWIEGAQPRYGIYSEPFVLDNRGKNCYLPIPFEDGLTITVTNGTDTEFMIFYQIDGVFLPSLAPETTFLTAQWTKFWPTPYGQDTTLFHDEGAGHFVGGFTFIHSLTNGWHGEGEMKIYLDDDDDLPTICGTGTEDYYGSAWCYNTPFCAPFVGLPFWSAPEQMAVAYRFHIPDPVIYRRRIRCDLQHLGFNPDFGGIFEIQNRIISVQFGYRERE